MSNAIEIEAKALVSKEEYEILSKKFKGYGRYTQTNHYIDSPDGVLSKEKLALRIRERDGRFEMTLKVPLSQGLLEKNCVWSEQTFIDFKEKGHFPDGDVKKMLLMLDINVDALHILTSLTTKRIDVPYKGGKLSIDKNHYSGLTDYEVELEHNNQMDAETYLREFLEEQGCRFVLNTKSKVGRAMEAYNREN